MPPTPHHPSLHVNVVMLQRFVKIKIDTSGKDSYWQWVCGRWSVQYFVILFKYCLEDTFNIQFHLTHSHHSISIHDQLAIACMLPSLQLKAPASCRENIQFKCLSVSDTATPNKHCVWSQPWDPIPGACLVPGTIFIVDQWENFTNYYDGFPAATLASEQAISITHYR